MSIKSKVLASAATLTLVGGFGTAGALSASSASAATPSCGSTCVEVFNHEFGTHRHPADVLDVFRQSARIGTPLILFRASNSDVAEDFTISFQGRVSDFFAAGLVSSAVNLHYGNGSVAGNDDFAYELEYTPLGVYSGECAGTAGSAVAGSKVVLVPCGATAKSVWIVDSADSTFSGYVPLINGSTVTFSHPMVLSYPKNGIPSDIPRPALTTQSLTGFTNGTFSNPSGVDDHQLWGFDQGIFP